MKFGVNKDQIDPPLKAFNNKNCNFKSKRLKWINVKNGTKINVLKLKISIQMNPCEK